MSDSYEQELAGVCALPGYMGRTLGEFARALRVTLEEEQRKPLPDNALVALLCDAARLGWEYLQLAKGNLKEHPGCPCKVCTRLKELREAT